MSGDDVCAAKEGGARGLAVVVDGGVLRPVEVGKLKLRGKAELPRRVETVDAARRGRLVEGPELVIVELRGDQRSNQREHSGN